MNMKHRIKKYMPIGIGIVFFTFFGFVTYKYLYIARKSNDQLIADHIEQLQGIFTAINDTAKIVGFVHNYDHIDYLTVKEFVGSTVGSLKLGEPHKWAGPYVNKDITIEGKEYQIAQALDGYYIIPGDGVDLSNGKIINKTLMITPETDMQPLLQDPKFLLAKNRPLAARIPMEHGYKPIENDRKMADQIHELGVIFKKINQDCKITGFRHEKDHIDFLNVKSFTGQVVGSMNVIHPDKWQGPYVTENPTVNGKFFQIIKARDGYYIVPDDGTVLSNGKIIGQTISFTPKSDMQELINVHGLMADGKPLAARIETVNQRAKADSLDDEPGTES